MLKYAALLWLALAAPALAQGCGGVDLSADPKIKPDFVKHADDLLNSEGLLWRVEKPGAAPSYLYGTMHSTQEGPMALARKAGPYAQSAKVIITELGDLDASVKIDLGAKMLQMALSPEADTFKGLIEGEDVARVEAMLTARGTPATLAHHLKLWMLTISTTLPPCEIDGQRKGLPEVDQSFVEIGKAKGLPVIALETADEQLNVIGAITPDLAAAEPKEMARGGAYADGGYATMLSLYLQRRPAQAVAVLDAEPDLTQSNRDSITKLTRALLADRNETMATRAAPWLAKGGAFIAVGALHLAGKGGLVELVRKQGYQVVKVW